MPYNEPFSCDVTVIVPSGDLSILAAVDIYTAELHLNYLKEVKVGTEVRVETTFLGHDAKRLHIFHTMYVGDGTEPVATNEQMQLSMDMTGPRVAPFQPDVLARIEAIATEHARKPRPAQAGRSIALPPKKG